MRLTRPLGAVGCLPRIGGEPRSMRISARFSIRDGSGKERRARRSVCAVQQRLTSDVFAVSCQLEEELTNAVRSAHPRLFWWSRSRGCPIEAPATRTICTWQSTCIRTGNSVFIETTGFEIIGFLPMVSRYVSHTLSPQFGHTRRRSDEPTRN